MRALLIGLQFLTRLPIRIEKPAPREISASYYFYPVIGLLIGIAAIFARHLVGIVLPASFSMVLMLGFLILLTGGLHEDGLADAADGMGGGWTRERRLDIMKDSHIGAFGTLALILALLAKYSALTTMNPVRVDAAILTAQMLGRWTFLPMGYFNPYAREGLGSEFMKGLSATAVGVGTVMTVATAAVISLFYGTAAFLIAAAAVFIASIYFRRRLGGVTGDCFGATFQIVEIATYAVFLV